VAEGEVTVNGIVVAKCNSLVKIGDLVEMPRGRRQRHEVEVLGLAESRGSARDAAALYRSVAITMV